MRLSARSAETNSDDQIAPGRAWRGARMRMSRLVSALFPTVRIKLVALLCAVATIITLLSGVFIFRVYEGQIDQRIFERMTSFMEILGSISADSKSHEEVDTFVRAFRTLPAIGIVAIADANGDIFATTKDDLKHKPLGALGWSDINAQLDASGGALVRAQGDNLGDAEFARRMVVGKAESTIYVRLNLDPMLETVRAAAWGLIVWLVAVVIVATLMVSLVLQRVLVSPIEALRDLADQRGTPGPVSFVKGARDEISLIAERLLEAFDATSNNEERLADLAQTDGLTGLGNRTHFKTRLAREITRAAESNTFLGVMVLNLDSFKAVNDSLGHDVGDIILQRTADILRGCQRPGDIIARLGADEFGVILTGLEAHADTTETAARFIRAVGAPFRAGGRELHQSACVGLTIYPQDGRDADVLMKNADLALSRAKHEGSGACILYRHELHLRAMERNSIERDLRAALAQKQFVLYYQPKVDIMTGRIKGAEALIRWLHPERGLVPPDLFIPVAEQCGIISDVTRWVLDEACRQNRFWQDQGLHPIDVAVNVSAVDLRRADLTDMVANTLVARGLSPQYLELEVTESMVMRDVDVVIGTLRRLRSLGVGIGIDDFGTGYSSLAYLKRFPVKRLKIDRSFISDIADGRGGKIIPKVIIDLAHALGVEVLAEGVEDMAQLQTLRQLGCDEAQGYFLGRPMPANEFAEFLARAEDGIHPRADIRAVTSLSPDEPFVEAEAALIGASIAVA